LRKAKGEIPFAFNKELPYIGVNLSGEPSGIAFFENCRVKGMDTSGITNLIAENFKKCEISVLYDHPYYAGIKELDLIREIIHFAKEEGIKIVRLDELL